MKGLRRREVVHPYICHLPISVFYILFSHVREREDTGEKRGGPCPPNVLFICLLLYSVVYFAQSCQTLRDTFVVRVVPQVC